MDGGGVGESSGAKVTTYFPGDSGAHPRLPGHGTIFPERAYQPGFLQGHIDSPIFPRQTRVVFLLYTIALLVGITRMYVGAHYPRDVLAGAILGIVWGLLGVLVNGYVLNGIG